VKHDLVIRSGTVVDGTGQERFTADVAIDGDRITEVGRVEGTGASEIDADGLVVTPGFVDIHTHYDGQVTWDRMLAPSSIHGVTSVVMGNCGVGFAPVRPGAERQEFLIKLMEGVEDIPGTALAEGLSWEWESLPEYFDHITAMGHTIDVGAQIPHAALRAYVMGERGADYHTDPNPEEIAEMGRLTAEALEAGAIGFATSRSVNHRTIEGQKIGTLTASDDELRGIAEALRSTGRGVLQFVSDFRDIDAELSLMRSLSDLADRPASVSLAQFDAKPDNWRKVLGWIDDAVADGARMKAQVLGRPIGFLVRLGGSMHPFIQCESWRPLADLSDADREIRMRDPELRRRLLAEARETRGSIYSFVARSPHRLFELGEVPDYEPPAEASIGARAEREGIDPMELVYDRLAAGETFFFPVGNYAEGNLDATREMILSDNTVFGLGDGGAHVTFICDGSYPTSNLTLWCRDRSRGERLPLELIVKGQTQDTASHVGWSDRGVLAPGYLADLNVIDMDRLALDSPTVINDLPAGGQRLMQTAQGYRHTIKRGEVSFTDGEHTGVFNGTLVRGAQGI